MADYNDKISLIRGVLEAAPKWNLEQNKSACRALFWLCDHMLADVESFARPESIGYVRSNMTSLQSYADEWARTGVINLQTLGDYYSRLLGMVPDEPLP